MKVRILNIKWDLCDEDSGKALTPKQAGVPEHIDIEVPDGEDINTAVEEYMDKNFDWCHKGFDLEVDPEEWEDYRIERIRNVLREYFQYKTNGELSLDYNPAYSATEAIDDILDIVGEI